MEQFQLLRERAKSRLLVADHMLTTTYPLIKDTKLLLVVMENIFLALSHSMSSLLYYDRLFKKIPPFHDSFESKFSMFKERCIHRYNIDKEYLILLQDIKKMMVEHKKSPVEFIRKDKFVICSDNYRMKTITINQLKDYISKTKVFVQRISTIVSKNDAIFN